MTDIPIIFSAPMVRALLDDGRKTMTRRLAWQPSHKAALVGCDYSSEELEDFDARGWNVEQRGQMTYVSKPTPWQRVKPGDRLWSRESLQSFAREPRATAQYVADITAVPHRGVVEGWCDGSAYWQWPRKALPSIHMPRWASRLTLIVTATKIERLQGISETEAEAEGVRLNLDVTPVKTWRGAFCDVWCSLHGIGAWKANPEVVALTFTVHKQNIDTLAKAQAA